LVGPSRKARQRVAPEEAQGLRYAPGIKFTDLWIWIPDLPLRGNPE